MTQAATRSELKRWKQLWERLPSSQRQALLEQAERYAAQVDERIRRLLRPRARKDGDHYLVSDSQTHLYGVGPTKEAAFADYRDALLEDFELLKESEPNLADYLQRELELLRAIFEPEGTA